MFEYNWVLAGVACWLEENTAHTSPICHHHVIKFRFSGSLTLIVLINHLGWVFGVLCVAMPINFLLRCVIFYSHRLQQFLRSVLIKSVVM